MHILEEKQPFSQSLIWQLQRNYFNEAGIDAWRNGVIPHYITNNPVVGKSYAELVLAFLRDLSLQGHRKETVYLLELGAGHGRLCYHFFKHFEKYYTQSGMEFPPFCYVLSDFVPDHLAFWQNHPRLQPYLEKGWLDMARFDAENDSELFLYYTGTAIRQQALSQPLLVVANYFFDTIPQELFRIEDQKIARSLLTLTTETDPSELDTADLIKVLQLQYDRGSPLHTAYPNEPVLNDLLEMYREQLNKSYLLFPHTGIRCLERLRQLSRKGLLVLSADKGEHRLPNLSDGPGLMPHGSFSLTVNYHALKHYCNRKGGLALFPRYRHTSLNIGCLLMLAEASSYGETVSAYEKFVNDYGPDDYFSLKKLAEDHLETLTYRHIMGMIRLSGYDARIFLQILPRLFELISDLSDEERRVLFHTVPRIWDTYYPLGEPQDLACKLGNLLFMLGFYSEAVLYFEKSVGIYGKKAGSLFGLACCYCYSGAFDLAAPVIRELLVRTPENKTLLKLVRNYESELFGEQHVKI
ncbi:MAG: hypothetical protein GKR88_09415 [Flavobacteriaceae bacterium]|nr:MAG: hypothetical protein GKR88_09415 [Flavobacteriaceae bacterium]